MHPLPPAPLSPVFSWPVRVYWEDTDGGGIVYYANYLKFFERARTEWLRALGLGQRELQETTGGIFVVSEAHVKYLRPAKLDDALHITVRLAEMGRTSLVIEQAARLEPTGPEDMPQTLCTGSIRIGWVDSQTFRPTRVPRIVQDALQQ